MPALFQQQRAPETPYSGDRKQGKRWLMQAVMGQVKGICAGILGSSIVRVVHQGIIGNIDDKGGL